MREPSVREAGEVYDLPSRQCDAEFRADFVEAIRFARHCSGRHRGADTGRLSPDSPPQYGKLNKG
jgi:hypothetical protein